jgi:predicted nucleotidyltransferase component of viral defense system
MDLKLLEKLKKLTIIAMVSDDYLMEKLVLKGGNALDLFYGISPRASLDLDFSMPDDFRKDEIENIKTKIEKSLRDTFAVEGFAVFDFKFTERPEQRRDDADPTWGGYGIEFKIISSDEFNKSKNLDYLRRHAIEVDSEHGRKLEIDISKFEYCEDKEEKDIEGYTVYVYPLRLILIEKIRAICQQVSDYQKIMGSSRKARARDFFDIYVIMKEINTDLNGNDNKGLLKTIFQTKKVPLRYLKLVRDDKEFHRQGFASLKDTMKPGMKLETFDFYFDYVADILEQIEFGEQ